MSLLALVTLLVSLSLSALMVVWCVFRLALAPAQTIAEQKKRAWER